MSRQQSMKKDNLSKVTLETAGGRQKVSIINEFGIYEAVFESRKPEAKDFKQRLSDEVVSSHHIKDGVAKSA